MFDYSTTKQGALRTITIEGRNYTYTSREVESGQDRFVYTLPDGSSYTHPTAEGCLLMILKHAAGQQ